MGSYLALIPKQKNRQTQDSALRKFPSALVYERRKRSFARNDVERGYSPILTAKCVHPGFSDRLSSNPDGLTSRR
jgi:hypothetical protein